MTRRSLLTAAGVVAAQHSLTAQEQSLAGKLAAPAAGRVPVAFPISKGAVVIDFCGPWEVFQDVQVPSGNENVPGFELYTVAETNDPIPVSGGMKVIPNYTFGDAPQPKVIVIPAQSGGKAMIEWIRKISEKADLTMSVCTGATVLADTGLLAGKAATTHHSAYGAFAMRYRDIKLKRGARFVEAGGNLASAGGLTSGMDLAMRVVERYYGRTIAERTAFYMEYQSNGWKDPSVNSVYAEKRKADDAACAVCGMAVSPTASLRTTYKNTIYRFCSDGCKNQFEAAPAEFVA